jgi:methylated-DNA-[protein]-cysteine S-methyltransferase
MLRIGSVKGAGMHDAVQLLIDRTETPIGELMIIADAEGRLHATDWTQSASRGIGPDRNSAESDGTERRLIEQLQRRYRLNISLEPALNPGGLTRAIDAYFAGNLAAIELIPVEAVGTPFQRAVWSALRTIPCGTTISYAELAQRVGRPSAVRAVGLANGSNPVSIVVPCHRVIGSDGRLVGYGGGLERKRWLLAHENRTEGLFPRSAY